MSHGPAVLLKFILHRESYFSAQLVGLHFSVVHGMVFSWLTIYWIVCMHCFALLRLDDPARGLTHRIEVIVYRLGEPLS